MKYTHAELKKADPKDWYVYYSYRNENGALIPFKIRGGINRVKDLKERKAYGTDLVAKTNKLLGEGWSPFVTAGSNKNPLGNLTLLETIDEVLKIKAPELRHKTNLTYKSTINIFKGFLLLNEIQGIKPKYFTPLNAQEYSDYLITVKKHAPKTHNNNLINIKTIFNLLKPRQLIDIKPFDGVKTKKEGEGRIIFYSDLQKQTIKKHLEASNHPLYLYVQLIFYCFIRPKELMDLKVKHIDFNSKNIIVPADIAKNSKNGIVPIHNKLFPLLKKKYHALDPETYLFGHKLLPNCNHYQRDRATESHREMLKGLGVSNEHKLYEWKHTGARLFILSGKNPFDLMIYMRHSSLDETMTYIRSLGINVAKNKIDPNAWRF